jgi:predicted PurR-regulated permease PerM
MAGPLATGILVIALLYFAQSIFVPLAFSLFAIALAWPVQAALQRWIPKLLALLVTLVLTILVIVTVCSSIAWGVSKLAQWLFLNAGRFQAVYADWVLWLEGHGVAIVGPITDRFDVTWLVGFVQGIAGRLNSLTGFALLVFIFVMLGLREVDDFNARLRLPAAQPYGEKILRANREIGRKLRRFMVVRSFASLLTGLVVWAFALLAGLELAAAWGAIAFALNYIPFLGPLIATLFPTLFAIAQFESWQMAVVVFLGLNIIQFIIGSYLEPLLTGASLAISPFAVIFAVFFGSFLWGLAGAFIGVPIMIVFIVYCAQEPSSRWLAVLLSGRDAGDISGGTQLPGR